jgi:predicted lipoprotein with Yx(FWY)xxD motif
MSTLITGRRVLAIGGAAMLAVAAVIAVMAMSAGAASTTVGVKRVMVGAKQTPIAVNTKGVALYTLSGDTKKHMECRKGNGCFAAWPPLKVKGHATKAAGVKGKLGTFKRNGFTQVTLNGHPLYLFAGDGGKSGTVNGDGLRSFGGTWHVVRAGQSSAAQAPSSPPGGGGGYQQPGGGGGW